MDNLMQKYRDIKGNLTYEVIGQDEIKNAKIDTIDTKTNLMQVFGKEMGNFFEEAIAQQFLNSDEKLVATTTKTFKPANWTGNTGKIRKLSAQDMNRIRTVAVQAANKLAPEARKFMEETTDKAINYTLKIGNKSFAAGSSHGDLGVALNNEFHYAMEMKFQTSEDESFVQWAERSDTQLFGEDNFDNWIKKRKRNFFTYDKEEKEWINGNYKKMNWSFISYKMGEGKNPSQTAIKLFLKRIIAKDMKFKQDEKFRKLVLYARSSKDRLAIHFDLDKLYSELIEPQKLSINRNTKSFSVEGMIDGKSQILLRFGSDYKMSKKGNTELKFYTKFHQKAFEFMNK